MSLSNKLAAGDLRHRISIAQATGTQDTFGGVPPGQWSIVLSCWAKIEALTGTDALAASEYVSSTSHQITIRYARGGPAITAGMIVYFKTRTFQIQAILNPDETNKMLYLMCLEIDNSSQQAPAPSA